MDRPGPNVATNSRNPAGHHPAGVPKEKRACGACVNVLLFLRSCSCRPYFGSQLDVPVLCHYRSRCSALLLTKCKMAGEKQADANTPSIQARRLMRLIRNKPFNALRRLQTAIICVYMCALEKLLRHKFSCSRNNRPRPSNKKY